MILPAWTSYPKPCSPSFAATTRPRSRSAGNTPPPTSPTCSTASANTTNKTPGRKPPSRQQHENPQRTYGGTHLVQRRDVIYEAGPRQRLLAPDDLAGRGPAGAPAVRELADHLKAAAVLVVAAGLAQPRQRARGVQHLADQRLFVDEPERDVAARVLDRVGYQRGDEQFCRRDHVLQIPALHRLGQHRTRLADRGQLGRERPRGVGVLRQPPEPGDEQGDVVALVVGIHPVQAG